MRAEDDPPTIPALATDIVVAYLAHHDVATNDIGRLVTVVARELGGLGQEPEPPARPEPAVPVARSVQRDHLVCLVCGQKFKSLRRHLQAAHQLTDSAYREMFGLGRSYPLVARASTEQRVAIAKRTQLGRRRPVEPEPEHQPTAVAEPLEAPQAVAEPAVDHAPVAQPEPAAAGDVAEAPAPVEAPPAAAEPAPRPVRGRRPVKKVAPAVAADLASQPQPEPEPEAGAKPRRRGRPKAEPKPKPD